MVIRFCFAEGGWEILKETFIRYISRVDVPRIHLQQVYTLKRPNEIDEIYFPSSSKGHADIYYTPKTENEINKTQVPFGLKV
jgi:hypothetical protein